MVFLADKEGRDIFQWKHGDRNTAGYPQYQTYISTKQIRPCRRFFSQRREENHRSFYVDTGWKARRQICSLSLVLDWVRFETNRFQVWPCTPRRPLHEIEILLEFFISSFLIYYLVFFFIFFLFSTDSNFNSRQWEQQGWNFPGKKFDISICFYFVGSNTSKKIFSIYGFFNWW